MISILFEIPFAGEMSTVVEKGAEWMNNAAFETVALSIAKEKVRRVYQTMVRPYRDWINEDYYVFQFYEVEDIQTASELVARHGSQIAQIIRGEKTPLSTGEESEILQSRLSYYPNDLVVVGWNGAVIYDNLPGAQTAIQLLEYANSQLLEFRCYDEFLTRELARVYALLRNQRGMFSRLALPKEMARLQAVTVEVTELVDRADNSIKFLSDMFSAKLYRLGAERIGVHDYKSLVNQKLHTAEDLYRSSPWIPEGSHTTHYPA